MILKTKIAAFPDNDMIDQRDRNKTAGAVELFGQFDIRL